MISERDDGNILTNRGQRETNRTIIIYAEVIPYAPRNDKLRPEAKGRRQGITASSLLHSCRANCDTLHDKAAYGVVSMHWPP